MHAATRRAKTPRLKPSANPWQALPRLADLFDPDAPQPFFKGSKVPELEELALTETQLLEQTAALLGMALHGAHLLLQTRTRVLNEDLDDLFRRWYPKFRSQPQTQQSERKAA